MAIYHLRLKVIGRELKTLFPGGATRRSAVAAAAYRSGERLFDMSQGRWFEYHKPDVVHTEIMIPEGEEVPDFLRDRQQLWNAVERSEKRIDSQLCREVEITLPKELSKEQQIKLVRKFVKAQFVDRGMIADFAIHCPTDILGRPQPHAHVLLTMRRVDPASPTGFSALKERDWNEVPEAARLVTAARRRFNDTGLEEDREALEAAEAGRNVNVWRKAWAEDANDALAAAGSGARIDHRTLEKQGIFRRPQINLGIARHVENAYTYIKDRVAQWVAIKKRQSLYDEVAYLKSRDTVALAEFVLKLADMAEEFVGQFRGSPGEAGWSHDR